MDPAIQVCVNNSLKASHAIGCAQYGEDSGTQFPSKIQPLTGEPQKTTSRTEARLARNHATVF